MGVCDYRFWIDATDGFPGQPGGRAFQSTRSDWYHCCPIKMPGHRYKHLIPGRYCEITWSWNMKLPVMIGVTSPLPRAGEGQGEGV
jgi:hypothetical protein